MKSTLMILAMAALPLAAQYRITNGDVRTRAAANLAQDVKTLGAAATPVWIAYAVPSVGGSHCEGRATLEDGRGSTRQEDKKGSTNLLVFLRAESGNVTRIRAWDEGCEIDAGGRTVHLLTGVRTGDSIGLMSSYAAGSDRRLSDAAVFVIAQHRGPEADAALARFTEPSQPEALRERAVFWLGASRGRPGYERLRTIVRGDPSSHVREKAVFALHVSKEPQAADALVELARNDKDPHVRGQALFWLGQGDDNRAITALSYAVESDPDREVRKKGRVRAEPVEE